MWCEYHCNFMRCMRQYFVENGVKFRLATFSTKVSTEQQNAELSHRKSIINFMKSTTSMADKYHIIFWHRNIHNKHVIKFLKLKVRWLRSMQGDAINVPWRFSSSSSLPRTPLPLARPPLRQTNGNAQLCRFPAAVTAT